MRECSLQSDLSGLTQCDAFVDRIIAVVTQDQGRSLPKKPFSKDAIGVLLRESIKGPQHCVHFCSFDQIGHHLVFEMYQGRARIFQAFAKGEEQTTAIAGAICILLWPWLWLWL